MVTHDRETEANRSENRRERSGPPSTDPAGGRVRRLATVGLGGALLVRGLERRSLRGMAMAAGGGWLLSRGVGGREGIEQTLRSQPIIGGRSDERTGLADSTAVSRSITIGKPAEELYEAWRDPEQFSQVMGHFADVSESGEDRFRWTVHGLRGRDLTWETEVVEDEPDERLQWETPEDAMLPNEGSVRFEHAPGDQGTEVTLSVSFDPPGGLLGDAALKRLDVVPNALAGKALRRFKSLVECGEIPTLDRNPSGRGSGDAV